MHKDDFIEVKLKPKAADPTNLAPKFEDKELKDLGVKCFDLYKNDDESRSKWLDVHTRYLEIYHQIDSYNSNFSDSFQGSDARVPLLTESCLAFQARSYKALFPQRSFVATQTMADITPEQISRAERVSKWMNFLLNFRQRRYKRDKKRMLLATPLMGSDFSKTFWDPALQMPVVQRVRAQDFVVAYGTGPRELEDIRRKTERITMDYNKAKTLYQRGFFSRMPIPADEAYQEPSNDEMQQVENEAEGIHEIKRDGKMCRIIEQHTFYDLDGDYIEEPIIIWIDENSKKVLRIAARYNPNDENKKPIEYYTHYQFIDNTDGFYGYGYGHLIANLNQALNQMLRNSIDAGELATFGNMGGFISDSLGAKGGEVEVPLGKFTKIPRTVEDIQKAIYQMQFPGPNSSYIGFVEYMQSVIQRLANTTEAVSGDVSKVYQPMTILTMLEQSLQLPSSIMENLALSMESELEKIFTLAAENALELETFTMGDERVSVTKDDFKVATRIYPVMDPRSVTKQQKMAKAQSVYQMAVTNPLIANDPMSLYNVTRQVLESMEVQDINEILKQPQNQKPERIDDQAAENMFFLMPTPQDRPLFDVFPEQDHREHLKIIDELLQGEASNVEATGQQTIPEETMQLLLMHKQKHTAYLYGQTHGVIKDGRGQLGAMEAQAGDAALLEALAQELQLGGGSLGLPTGESGAVPGTGGGFEGSGELPGQGILERVPLDQRNVGVTQ